MIFFASDLLKYGILKSASIVTSAIGILKRSGFDINLN